jgi:hypothetical protein
MSLLGAIGAVICGLAAEAGASGNVREDVANTQTDKVPEAVVVRRNYTAAAGTTSRGAGDDCLRVRADS